MVINMVIKDFKVMSAGSAEAEGLVSGMPLSFWGGVRAETGEIQDVHHDLFKKNLTGKILCIPYDRGSCSGAGVLLEMIRRHTNPAGILCIEAEAVLALGPVIGQKMYKRSLPIRTVSKEDFNAVPKNCRIRFTDDEIIIETNRPHR